MIGENNPITSRLTNAFRESTVNLSDTLKRLASGRNFIDASDSLIGFLKKTNLEIDLRGYEDIRRNLTDAKTVVAAAIQSGSTVHEQLTEMKKYAKKYIDETANENDQDKLAEYKAEFESLKESAVNTLQNAYVDGMLVTQSQTPLKTVSLDPDNLGQLSINFSVVPDDSQIDTFNIAALTNSDAIDAEITNSLTYMSESKSYGAIIDRQINLSGLIFNSKESLRSLITDIDEAKVVTEAVDQSIRYEVAGAMFAQGNIEQISVCSLYNTS